MKTGRNISSMKEATVQKLPEESYDMISVATIAEIAGAQPEEAQRWVEDPSFPRAVAHFSSGKLYDRRATERWLLERGHLGLEIPPAP
jgi:hypothetical protein